MFVGLAYWQLCLVFSHLNYGFLKSGIMWIMSHRNYHILRKLDISMRRWFIMISHLSCLSFKISHHFTGIITLIYFREHKPKLHTDRSDQKPLFHWLNLSVLAEGRVSATSPVESWSIAGRVFLQTKHTSSSPSTRKNRCKYHKFQSIVYSSLHPIEKNQNNKTKTEPNNTTPPPIPQTTRKEKNQHHPRKMIWEKREHMDLYLRHFYLQHLSTFQVMSSPA